MSALLPQPEACRSRAARKGYRMAPNEADALVADLCRNLALLRRCAGGIHQTEANLLARYRAVVDALGCREAFEEALLQQVLQPWSADERGARIADAG